MNALKRKEIVQELAIARAVENGDDEVIDGLVVLRVGVLPATVHLGLVKRLGHEGPHPVAKGAELLVVKLLDRPGAQEVLVEEVLLVAVREPDGPRSGRDARC